MDAKTIFILVIIFNIGLLNNMYAQGYLVRSIAQELTFPDWKNIIKSE